MSEEKLYVVRLWDGMDGVWIDVSDPVLKKKAEEIWNEKTNGGTEKTNYDDIDYYVIHEAGTTMRYSREGAGPMHRRRK